MTAITLLLRPPDNNPIALLLSHHKNKNTEPDISPPDGYAFLTIGRNRYLLDENKDYLTDKI